MKPDTIYWTEERMTLFRVVRRPDGSIRCDCACACHAGRCGLAIDDTTSDCERGCRAAHILASECIIDENRNRVLPVEAPAVFR